MKNLPWHESDEIPTEKGWYECLAPDDRWGGKSAYRAWGNGMWWIPQEDGWLGCEEGWGWRWRGPVADINGPAPDGTNPRSEKSQ